MRPRSTEEVQGCSLMLLSPGSGHPSLQPGQSLPILSAAARTRLRSESSPGLWLESHRLITDVLGRIFPQAERLRCRSQLLRREHFCVQLGFF